FFFALIYLAVPPLTGRQWLSRTATNAHFWVSAIGIGIMAVAMWTGGLSEGLTWTAGSIADVGTNASEGFEAAVRAVQPFTLVAFIGLFVFMLGQVGFAAHLLATVAGVRTLRPEAAEAEMEELEETAEEPVEPTEEAAARVEEERE